MTIREFENYDPSHFYDMKSQLKDYIYDRTRKSLEKGRIHRSQISTKEQLKKRQAYIRKLFLDSLGGIPSCETPLKPQVTGTITGNGFHIEKVIYQSRPDCFVTANLYIPNGLQKPSGAVLFLCGHDPLAKHSEEYQMVCQCLTKRGLIVLALDPIGQGERLSYYDNGIEVINQGTTEHTHAGFQCLMTGYPSARYFLHDALRGIDYLLTRPEVDPANIGVTGNSGGGTQTSMLMLWDDRVKAFAPGTFITGYEENLLTGVPQDAEQNWPGLIQYGFDHEDILLSVAPKPVAVLAASYDFFPIEGTRKTVEAARKYWEIWGKEEDLHYIEDVSKHSYSYQLAQAAGEFFAKTLGVTAGEAIPYEDIKLFEQSELWCTGKGQIREERKNTRFIFEENLTLLTRLQEEREIQEEENRKKDRVYNWLKEQVFYQRVPCPVNLRDIGEFDYYNLSVKSYIWRSQERIMNHCLAFKDHTFHNTASCPIIAVWDGGTGKLEEHIDWIKGQCQKGKTIFVLNTSGVGGISPYPIGIRGMGDMFGTMYKLADDLIRFGDSLCALRIYDVIRMVDMLQEFDGTDHENIHIYAHGKQGVYGILAAFIDKRIKNLSIEQPMPSYGSWVGDRCYTMEDAMSIILPQALKFFDLDEIYEWLMKEERLEQPLRKERGK
ncbi:alpha/beta hydrolase family protein [Anaerocolumna aminovalerica]|uniref:Acetyl xylan esterase (AXE1) n=1 Tax=Anaerocolumna aminovalerica TaxID=1527 RepID=A0A1I5DYG8_9FIRM|nr:hypothetical protein [Anaerocolumna aminovalerica]SFO04305.1 hypothetical protein SAMN04489757_10771 [Anaerocolumna aminovalerica]